MEEKWVPIKGFEGRYEVSDLGRIRGLERLVLYKDGRSFIKKPKMLKGSLGNHGYMVITLDSKTKKTIHRLVMENFSQEPEYQQTVNHIDGNKLNNKLSNLCWATYKENNEHARQTNLCNQHGHNCNLTKFSDQIIQAVKRSKNIIDASTASLIFDMSKSHVYEIWKNQTRKKMTA